MTNPWFKFYGGEYLSDPKMLNLNGDERSCWITLMCLFSQNNGQEIKFLSEKQLLFLSGIQEEIKVLDKFEELGLISRCNGNVTLPNWEKRQYSEGYSRVKKFRDNKKITIEEKREEEKRIDKSIYGEFKNVLLTLEEHLKLIEKIGEKNTNLLIEELSGYLASTRKKYESHYATLLNWARRKVGEHQKVLSAKTKTIA